MSNEKENGEEEAQAEVEMWNYIFGFTNMAVVKCAIELGISDAVENHKEPVTLSELSSTLECDPPALYSIMRFLVHNKIFKESPTHKGATGYAHTPLSRRLLGRGESSMKAFLLLESSQVMLSPWNFLSSRVRANGRAAFEAANGDDVWKFAAENTDHCRLIDDGMACNARNVVGKIIEKCREVFDGVHSLVDVGGGNGTAIGMLVKAFPWIDGINFDVAHVISAAKECDGVTQVAGDMFECVPKADAAFFMWVLHDWDDEECIQILKKCKEAISESNGKVIIVDQVIGDVKNDKFEFVRLMLDMVMMAHTVKGKERTAKEWEYVLQKAGFSSHTIKYFGAVPSIIEAFP
ncbi:acetylserotonin O-methyltransferase-like [Mercurialis annua]|uniref:acetylserotonin O-methyltransferase-like n=1 Tax=Mercurialis annua TaxID=3986 RepID=UPI00215F1CE4|nr:acetylserotonin O-methyltransferase-like [Mercurialis annua]